MNDNYFSKVKRCFRLTAASFSGSVKWMLPIYIVGSVTLVVAVSGMYLEGSGESVGEYGFQVFLAMFFPSLYSVTSISGLISSKLLPSAGITEFYHRKYIPLHINLVILLFTLGELLFSAAVFGLYHADMEKFFDVAGLILFEYIICDAMVSAFYYFLILKKNNVSHGLTAAICIIVVITVGLMPFFIGEAYDSLIAAYGISFCDMAVTAALWGALCFIVSHGAAGYSYKNDCIKRISSSVRVSGALADMK